MHRRDDIDVTLLWRRVRLFDRASVIILFERCLAAKMANVSKVQQKPTKRWKPLPLTTVEFQKMATRFLRMTGSKAMEVAEKLYMKGFISYPRTETDRFDRGMNLQALVEKQVNDRNWGQFARGLMDGGFQQPREGRNDDKAHPPIHPIAPCARFDTDEERRVYELVCRRFLACCSQDAVGTARDIEIELGDESFHAHGVVIEARNYLDVYPYDKWTGNILPKFTLGGQFEPEQALMTEGKTGPPNYLTEPDLIALMDANGIGTDATMAEHISKVLQRGYITPRPAPGASGVTEFIPSALGVALVKGYDQIGLDTSLSKPFLRKEMELRMKQICDGRSARVDVVRESIGQYKQVFERTEQNIGVLKQVCSLLPAA
jgi:DNA topoisomerase-3